MKRPHDDDMSGEGRNRSRVQDPPSPTFQTKPVSRFQKNFPYFRQPKEVGYFSHDKDRQIQHTKAQLKFYVPPSEPGNVHFDLTHGYDVFIKKDDSVKDYVDDLLKWIVANDAAFAVQGKHDVNKGDLSTDFICWRGLLTRLLCTPYENREGWIISVTRFNGSWYLCEYDTAERLLQRTTMDAKHKLMTYGGWKFEQYVVADSPDSHPDTSKPVNNKEAFCSVVRGRLAEHSLVYGGEVDCTGVTDASSSQQKIAENYVELKTIFEFKHPGQERNFKRFKLIKFWAQSFLIGISRIVVGFKDNNGVVRRLEEIETRKIPSMVKDIPNPWEPTVCFNFLSQFLQHVKSTATVDDPRSAYVFKWKPGQDITSTFYPDKSAFTFLPDWYIAERQ